jgi:transcription initiation factor TFIID subunit 9B
MQLEKSFTNPPPREVLLTVAKVKNNIPLPFVKPSYGLRLPPDRYCLNGTNYKLKSSRKKSGKMGFGNMSITGSLGRINSQGFSIVKRPGTMSTMSRTQTISISKPVFKVSASKDTYIK